MTGDTLHDDSILLLGTNCGFRYSYVRQLWHRVCRSGVSFQAEAYTIVVSAPKPKSKFFNGSPAYLETRLAAHLCTVLFHFLRFQEGRYDFLIDDPVPVSDAVYGVPLKDTHIIYNQPHADPSLKGRFKYFDVVADGCMPVARRLCDDERIGLKRLRGRPVRKTSEGK